MSDWLASVTTGLIASPIAGTFRVLVLDQSCSYGSPYQLQQTPMTIDALVCILTTAEQRGEFLGYYKPRIIHADATYRPLWGTVALRDGRNGFAQHFAANVDSSG